MGCLALRAALTPGPPTRQPSSSSLALMHRRALTHQCCHQQRVTRCNLHSSLPFKHPTAVYCPARRPHPYAASKRLAPYQLTPMGLEVPCTLNPRRSAGCPNRARSKSEGYAGDFQLGKLRVHNPCTIVPNRPHSPERGPGHQGFLQLTINQFQVSHSVLK